LAGKQGPLVYLASVQAGGEVKGELMLSGDLQGKLNVKGSFEDGRMSYVGELSGV
jgi:hypothetical protein